MTFLTKTWTHLRRSPFQGLAAVMTMTLTLLVIAFFAPGEDLVDTQIANIRAQLTATGKLNQFRYVSTHEAEAIYKEKNKDNPLLLELVDYKILPASIEISANQLNDLAGLKAILQTQEGVEDVVFYEDIIQSLQNWISSVEKLGAIAIAYLTLESILVILVIIGLQISSRREEIEILKLLGATNWFIKKPFIVNGLMYGLVGSFLAWSVSYILLLYATPFLANWLGDIPLLPVP